MFRAEGDRRNFWCARGFEYVKQGLLVNLFTSATYLGRFVVKRSSLLNLLITVALITGLFGGCSRDPNVRKQKYLESGQRYFDKAKYREAAIQFSNAVQVDSRFTEAHYQLAQTYLKLQEWTRAYQELSRTLELEPEHWQAHIDVANLLIAGHDLKQAQEHTDLLLAKQPNNAQVHEAVANLLAGKDNFPA